MSDDEGELGKLVVPLTGIELVNAMARPASKEQTIAFFKGQHRRQLLLELARAYRAYAFKPEAPGRVFAAMRALIKACRAHDMTIEHAALFAMMGQVGESAISPVKLSLLLRPETRAMRQREHARHKLNNARHIRNRNREIFRQILFYAVENTSAENQAAYSEAFGPVGEQYGLGDESVRKIFQAEAKRLRDDGTGAVLFERGDEQRLIPIPQGPGRMPKRGQPKKGE
jgi:hypothetical protein